jgi:acyl carrier protein
MKYEIKDLESIFKDVLENNEIILTEKTVATDIPEWDSLNHIYLVVAIENFFKVKFTSLQIQSWKCVGDILEELNRKQ